MARVLSTSNSGDPNQSCNFLMVGPTYKADVTVNGMKTHALLDHTLPVTMACHDQQLMPMVREKQQWSLDTCVNRVIPLKFQPIASS